MPTKKVKVSGFSLIELMVSIAIAAIILTGVVKVAFNAKRSSFDGEQLSFVQDNARFVLDQIKREIRLSGYTGCAALESARKSNTVVDDVSGFIKFNESIQGFDNSQTDFPSAYASDVKTGTDSFLVRFGDASSEVSVKSHNPTSAGFTLWQEETFAVGTTMMITDTSCREVGLFQVTASDGDSLSHSSDGTRNCTRILRATTSEVNCASGCADDSCPGNAEKAFNVGSTIMPYRVNAYYVGDSDIISGMPALKKQTLTASGGTATTETEEVAVGVEDLQVLYGLDLDDDKEANQYLRADQVTDWSLVVALRLTLVFRSDREVFASDQSINIKLDGSDYQLSSDRYLRQVVSTSVKIRNI